VTQNSNIGGEPSASSANAEPKGAAASARGAGSPSTDANTTVAALRQQMAAFVRARDWEQFHDPKNLAASIAIEAAELMEHFQWLRSDQLAGLPDDPEAMQQIREELADVLAFVISFANRMEIDLAQAFTDKMVKNARKYPEDKFRGRFR
jgi:dCTP diphosphatase